MADLLAQIRAERAAACTWLPAPEAPSPRPTDDETPAVGTERQED